MSHPLVPQLIQMLEEATQFDFSTAPAVKFMAELRDNLKADRFTTEEAETIVASMEIDIPPDAIEDEDIVTLAKLYADIYIKAHQALIDNGFTYPMAALLQTAKKFTLTLS